MPLLAILVVLFCLFVVLPVATHVLVFVHELGHSLVALLFSEGTVEMYVGSYGDKDKSWKIRLGRLHMYVENRSVLWKKGICVPGNAMRKPWQGAAMVFAGPAFSLLFGLALWVWAYGGTPPEGIVWRILAPIFIATAVADFVRNILPNKRPIVTKRGTTTYNDGQLLWEMFFQKQQLRDFNEALAMIAQQNFGAAAPVFERLAQSGFRQQEAYQWAVAAYWHAGDSEKAIALAQLDYFGNTYRSTNRSDLGILLSMAGKNAQALLIFDELVAEAPNDRTALANQGFVLILLGRYEEAKKNFERIVAENPDDAYAISQLAFATYRLNGAPHGVGEMKKASEMAPEDPYVLRNLAIYQLEQNQVAEAEALFRKIQDINPFVPEVKDYLDALAKKTPV